MVFQRSHCSAPGVDIAPLFVFFDIGKALAESPSLIIFQWDYHPSLGVDIATLFVFFHLNKTFFREFLKIVILSQYIAGIIQQSHCSATKPFDDKLCVCNYSWLSGQPNHIRQDQTSLLFGLVKTGSRFQNVRGLLSALNPGSFRSIPQCRRVPAGLCFVASGQGSQQPCRKGQGKSKADTFFCGFVHADFSFIPICSVALSGSLIPDRRTLRFSAFPAAEALAALRRKGVTNFYKYLFNRDKHRCPLWVLLVRRFHQICQKTDKQGL